MDIIGKITVALPEMSGTSKAGNAWKKREYVLETLGDRPRSVHFDLFGSLADQYPLRIGQMIKLYFDIESREYNGRWFTSIRGWKVEDPNASFQQPQQAYGAPAAYPQQPQYPQQPYAPQQQFNQPAPGAVPPPPAMPTPDATDDLPF